MSTLFVYNKKAGRRFRSSLLDVIRTHVPADQHHDMVEVQQLDGFDVSPYDILVAVGGDGTVNSVASKAFHNNKVLAIIPKGSGDGLARFLNIPRSIGPAIDLIFRGNTSKIDAGFIGEHFFVNVVGNGFEAKVAHRFGDRSVRGLRGYVQTISKLFRSHEEREVRLKIDGKKKVVRYFSLSIANGGQWGNNFEIASKADLQDGLFDIAIMRKPRILDIPFLLAYLRNKKQRNTKLIRYYKASEIDIKKSGKYWHIDGEPIVLKKKKEVRIVPQALTIIVP